MSAIHVDARTGRGPLDLLQVCPLPDGPAAAPAGRRDFDLHLRRAQETSTPYAPPAPSSPPEPPQPYESSPPAAPSPTEPMRDDARPEEEAAHREDDATATAVDPERRQHDDPSDDPSLAEEAAAVSQPAPSPTTQPADRVESGAPQSEGEPAAAVDPDEPSPDAKKSEGKHGRSRTGKSAAGMADASTHPGVQDDKTVAEQSAAASGAKLADEAILDAKSLQSGQTTDASTSTTAAPTTETTPTAGDAPATAAALAALAAGQSAVAAESAADATTGAAQGAIASTAASVVAVGASRSEDLTGTSTAGSARRAPNRNTARAVAQATGSGEAAGASDNADAAEPAPSAVTTPAVSPADAAVRVTAALQQGDTPADGPNKPLQSVHGSAAEGRRPAEAAGGAARADNAATEVDQADRIRIVQRVVRAVEAAADRGGQIRMKLYPPELGSLRLEMTVRNGVMNARLEAETESARRLLVENLGVLRERLAEHNIRVDRLDVEVSPGTTGGTPQHADSQQRWQERPAGAGGAAGNRPREEATPAEPRTVAPSRHGAQLDVVI